MEALETAINYWDDALAAYTSGGGGPLAVTSSEEAGFCKELQGLVDAAYRLQDQCELLFLDQVRVAMSEDSCSWRSVATWPVRAVRTVSVAYLQHEIFVFFAC
jgi:hypothetical protein